MAMVLVNTIQSVRDLIDLTREIEAGEGLSRRAALRMAMHEMDVCRLMVEADVRYVPAGWQLRPHVSVSIPPMTMRYSDVIPHG